MTDNLISSGPVLLDLEPNGIARIRLNRPDASNGMDVSFLQALHAAILRAHGEPRTRVVVLTGEGKNFCAGGDVKTFASKGDGLPDYLREATAWLQIATSALIDLKVPVIASVQGFAGRAEDCGVQ
ncbi:enoyl-CoA hydratase/isomerase family protein, partial [Rhodococcus pyridinivorans]|uniref:enoyl-CoA hydratase/isomerase family protein n=1 Tax=Rhodococcus pyridinivorans TaxID=103816 RepID=UPI002227B615